MERETFFTRTNYIERLNEYGFDYHTVDNIPYWQEKAAYHFEASEIDQIEAATKKLSDMCLAAVEFVIKNNRFAQLQIPEKCIPLIKKSWERDDFTFYGRFDLVLKDGKVKMYEYNADTPTSFLEAGLAQWFWKEDRKKEDQFNSIHDTGIEQWKHFKDTEKPNKVYFSCVRESLEDFRNTEYIMDLAKQAGLEVDFLFMDQIS